MNKIIDIKLTEDTPGTEPLTLSEVKSHLEVTYSDKDTLLTSLITQVRQWVELITSLTLVPKTCILTADWVQEWELPFAPHGAISEVKYRTGTSTSGTPEYETLIDDDYTTDGEDIKVFNSAFCGRHKITYACGYTNVPDGLKLAMLNEIAFRFQNRGDGEGGSSSGAMELLKPYISYAW